MTAFDGPRWLVIRFPDGHDATVRQCKLKCFGHKQGVEQGHVADVVWFELIDILSALNPKGHGEKIILHKEVKKMHDSIGTMCEKWDTSFDDVVLRSRRAHPPGSPSGLGGQPLC